MMKGAAVEQAAPGESGSIYSVSFILVCMSSLLFSTSFNMLIPELPSYLSSLGGAQYKGLIIALFTLTAGFSRPFSGKLTDTIGRVPVMAVGSLVCFVCGFLYPVLGTVAGFLFLRLFHGFSTGFKPTATAAYVADMVPVSRWGEALGIHGLCTSTGMALGPAIGSAIGARFTINVLFYSSSFLALMSIVIIMNMKDTLKDRKPFRPSALRISKKDLIEWRAIPAAVVCLLSYVAYGVILTLIPDWSEHLGISNKGLYFMVFTLSSLLIRFLAGKMSDRMGRVRVIEAGLVILIVSLVITGYSRHFAGFLTGSVLYGIASGILSPAISAWTIDLSHPEHRGKATATMYISLESGIGIGALIAGWIYQDRLGMVPLLFYLSAFISALPVIYILLYKKYGGRRYLIWGKVREDQAPADNAFGKQEAAALSSEVFDD